MGAPAKDRFTGLDTLALVRELRALPRPRLDKVFDAPGPSFDLLFRSPGTGRRVLRLCPGRYGALLTPTEEREEGLSPFAKELRRLLSGAVLQEVADPAGERWLELGLLRGDVPEPLKLTAEFFGAGNLLVARGGTLVAVLHPRTWAARTVRIGAEYRAPPTRANPWAIERALWAGALQGSRNDLVSSLAARLGLGGPIAEELLARTGLDGSVPAAGVTSSEVDALAGAAQQLLESLGERPAGFLYRSKDGEVDVEPFESLRWRRDPSVTLERFERFSEASQAYFGARSAAPSEPGPGQQRREELARHRTRQEVAIRALEAESDRLRRLAETILARYPEVEAGLARLASAPGGPVVELELDGLRLPLRVDRTPRESAQLLFDERKRVELKLAGARAALAATEVEERASPPRGAAAPRSADPGPRARPLWFERYRWFLSSEGILAIAGRDAASNDRIVKRYLGPNDRYVHADLHGAASVVVKHPEAREGEIGEETMREAGQWAVAFSKAWRAGRGSADAFWVESEQVSKTPASGEFVARGSWVIHGTKHPLHDLPLELALGRVAVEGGERWTVAPLASVRARGSAEYLIRPGEERLRLEIEGELARALSVPRNTLQALLPAGGIQVERLSGAPGRKGGPDA